LTLALDRQQQESIQRESLVQQLGLVLCQLVAEGKQALTYLSQPLSSQHKILQHMFVAKPYPTITFRTMQKAPVCMLLATQAKQLSCTAGGTVSNTSVPC
jgi:hypothetical protein